jgi:hypothetical protein
MLAKSETVSAVLRARPDIADQRAEAGAIARGLTMLFKIIFFLRLVGCGHGAALKSNRSSDGNPRVEVRSLGDAHLGRVEN